MLKLEKTLIEKFASVTTCNDDFTATIKIVISELNNDNNFENNVKNIVKTVNKHLFNNAVDYIIFSDIPFTILTNKIVYGGYAVKFPSDTYELTAIEKIKKTVKFKDKDGNEKTEERDKFITYDDVKKRIAVINKTAENKITLKQDFDLKQFSLVDVFTSNIYNEFSGVENSILNSLPDSDIFKPFKDNSINAMTKQLEYFYSIINNFTGKTVKPIKAVVKNIQIEVLNFNSVYFTEKQVNNVKMLSIIVNHYINSELAIITKSVNVDNAIKALNDK